MKIYLRVHKDQGQYVVNLWSKHIKEQIIKESLILDPIRIRCFCPIFPV